MLKLIHSMADLDSEQLLDIYKEHAWDELDFLSYLQEECMQQLLAYIQNYNER